MIKIYKIVTAVLFSLLFMTTVSADTGTINGSIQHTSMTNNTVTMRSDSGNDEVINHVPSSVITDINNQQNAPLGVRYTYTFTVQNHGRYQDYTYKKQDERLLTYIGIGVMIVFVLAAVLVTGNMHG